MEALLDALEQVQLRVRCGQTLTQATASMPIIQAAPEICRDWLRLRTRIEEGSAPADAALGAWIQQLRLRHRLQALIRNKSAGPRAQALCVSALAWLFGLAAMTVFPESLRPSWSLAGIVVLWLLIGSLWVRREIQKAQAGLWFSDWLLLLSDLANSLAWGQTFGPALATAKASRPDRPLPPSLNDALIQLEEACRSYSPLDLAAPPESSRASDRPLRSSNLELQTAWHQLRWMNELRERGEPMLATIESFLKHSFESFERRTTAQAERLSLKLLWPLFICFLPSFLLLLFGPILATLLSAASVT